MLTWSDILDYLRIGWIFRSFNFNSLIRYKSLNFPQLFFFIYLKISNYHTHICEPRGTYVSSMHICEPALFPLLVSRWISANESTPLWLISAGLTWDPCRTLPKETRTTPSVAESMNCCRSSGRALASLHCMRPRKTKHYFGKFSNCSNKGFKLMGKFLKSFWARHGLNRKCLPTSITFATLHWLKQTCIIPQ